MTIYGGIEDGCVKKVLGAGGGGGPLLRGNPGAVRRGETPPVRGSPGREYMLLYLVSQQSRNAPETLKLFSRIKYA